MTAPFCRCCGTQHNVGYRSKWALEGLGVEVALCWLDGLCNECCHGVGREIPQNVDGYPLRAAEPIDLENFLAKWMREVARRVADGRSPLLCEALVASWLSDELPRQCARFSSHDVNGRRLCGHCARKARGGKPLSLVGQHEFPPRLFMFWARSADELMEQARFVTMTDDRDSSALERRV